MKKIIISFLSLFILLTLSGCEIKDSENKSNIEDNENIKYYDKDFIMSLEKGYSNRWIEVKKINDSNGDVTAEELKRTILLELDEIKEYEDLKFEDGKLKELAIKYINLLRDDLELADTYDGSLSFYSTWDEGLDKRTEVLSQINEIIKLDVTNQEVKKGLAEALARGKKVVSESNNDETTRIFVNNFNFQKNEGESDEYFSTFDAIIENTTNLSFDYLYVEIKLKDEEGIVVDTESISENNWIISEKRKLSFITDKEFSTMELIVDSYSVK
ncbi:hypothetical protein [Streptococcus sp. CSL10205-OR2]|uniref:hypothetical protein n=1 Tax=Streptococcus sp. CSL10205-OR2 TaxID=2980558 RepID=UPI0021D91747|nr:hypothetical protein [Streptococcus sp. CSL10205-OR2]MCU9534067.1 hypothetical protein [Streptococcus sp. CSL10205-OR2]